MDNINEMYKVIDLEDFNLKSVNDKFVKSKFTGKFCLKTEYKVFKQILQYAIKKPKVKLDPPYAVHMFIETCLDIDNPIKAILDALEGIVIKDDKLIHRLIVDKKPRERGQMSSLRVYIGSL